MIQNLVFDCADIPIFEPRWVYRGIASASIGRPKSLPMRKWPMGLHQVVVVEDLRH